MTGKASRREAHPSLPDLLWEQVSHDCRSLPTRLLEEGHKRARLVDGLACPRRTATVRTGTPAARRRVAAKWGDRAGGATLSPSNLIPIRGVTCAYVLLRT